MSASRATETAPTGFDRRYGEAARAATRALAASSSTPELEAQLLLARAAGATRSIVLAFPERELDGAAAERFARLVERRAAGEPLAYLLGEREFYALTLAVSPAVLVPRPETEHLVEEILGRLPMEPGLRVLDLGTGSGALALALKRQRPDLDVLGADISEAALGIARANGDRLGLDVRFVWSDWFSRLGGERFHAILCNPPYVRSGDPHVEQLRFEPRLALDGGADGLRAIRAVLAEAPAHLESDGRLLIEHGHDQQREVIVLAERLGLKLEKAGRDLAGLDRYVVFELRR